MVETNITNNKHPQDVIIHHIRKALQSGELKPGQRLPAERKMAEEFGVGRTHVRDALKTLENYGIIKTLPQSGSVIVGLDITALDGLIADVLKLDGYDFASLAEMRVILEMNAARLCALRRTNNNLKEIEAALNAYIAAFKNESEEVTSLDFHFHRCIAQATQNSVLNSMIMLITPDIMTIYQREKVCSPSNHDSYSEHIELFNLIKQQKGDEASDLMSKHLTGVLEFARAQRER